MKAAPVTRALAARHEPVLVHTGQHYDANMSAVFFDDLDLPRPDFALGVGSGSHADQTAAMLVKIEAVLLDAQPDWVVVYGDTNSTLAGALAASKLCMPIAHVEAGLRSFNRQMPEEINRVVADHLSTLLLCPSDAAVSHLRAEGMRQGVHQVGDVMADAVMPLAQRARERSTLIADLGLKPRDFVLATIHRAENTDDPGRLGAILGALDAIDERVILPLHPRTRKILDGQRFTGHVTMIDAVGYLDMLQLTQHARLIVTDSGGLQKEAYWLGVPCVTVRDETEWVETVAAGWNVVVGADRARIEAAIRGFSPPSARPPLYGDGHAAERIVTLLETAH